MLLIEETINKFNYNPTLLKSMSSKRVLYSCVKCNKILESQMCTYTRGNKLCKSCSKIQSHQDNNSKYNSLSYKQKRSEIAKKSNKNRKLSSEKFKKYLPFLEKLKNNQISFKEIADKLKLDDSTVCRFFHNNFNLKSNINYSIQEKVVGKYLEQIFGEIEYQKRYNDITRHKSDYYIKNLGHIEYDGNDFYHLKKSDGEIDKKYNPIRLSAQAYIGGIDYLTWLLKDERPGYCNVKSVKEYNVEIILNQKKSTEMLENCHPLGNCTGTKVFGLFYKDKLIGVAKFGNPTNKNDNGCLELRRFFILDGTPKNTESYFLRQCEKQLSGNLLTYIHFHEKGCYLKALGWKQLPNNNKNYDIYLVNNKL